MPMVEVSNGGTTEVTYVNKYRSTRNSQQTAQLDASKNYMLFVYLAYTDTSSSSRAEAYTIINNEMSKIMTGTGTYGVVSYNTSTHVLTMKGTDPDGTITWFTLFALN